MAAAATPLDIDIQQPCIFAGEDTNVKNALTPREFLKEILARRAKAEWTDARTMKYIEGSLKGSAVRWFHDGMKYRLPTTAAHDKFKTDFAEFKLQFCKIFGLHDAEETRSTRNLAGQTSDENDVVFVDRICSRINASTKYGEVEINHETECNFDPAIFTDDSTPERRKAALIAYLRAEYKPLVTEKTARGISGELIRTTVADGLMNRELRRDVYMMLEDNKSCEDILNFVNSRKQSTKYAGAGTNKALRGRERRAQVDQIDEDVHIDDEAEIPIDKISARNGRKKASKPKKKSQPNVNAASASDNAAPFNSNNARPNDRNSRRCSYCNKPGHLITSCYFKRYNDENGYTKAGHNVAAVRQNTDGSGAHVAQSLSVEQIDALRSLLVQNPTAGNANGAVWM